MPWESAVPLSLAFNVNGINNGHQGISSPSSTPPLLFLLSVLQVPFCCQASSSDAEMCHALDLGTGPVTEIRSGSAQKHSTEWEPDRWSRTGQGKGNSGTMATEGSPSEREGAV